MQSTTSNKMETQKARKCRRRFTLPWHRSALELSAFACDTPTRVETAASELAESLHVVGWLYS